MAALVEPHPENGVARLKKRHVDRHIGVAARVRLHVGMLGAEQLLGPVDSQLLGLVNQLLDLVE